MDYLTYALIAALATILGGLLPMYTRIKRIKLSYLIGFASGVLISTAFFEMIPEIGGEVFALGIGFFSLYFIEKLLMIHACGEKECKTHSIGWISVSGIGVHSLIDGVAIATGYAINPILGLVVALAVIVHEIPEGFSTTVIMKSAKYKNNKILLTLSIVGFLTPIGALLSGIIPPWLFKSVLAFSAGTFIYIGASDLLPEAHKRFDLKVILSVLLGAALIPVLEMLI